MMMDDVDLNLSAEDSAAETSAVIVIDVGGTKMFGVLVNLVR